MTDRSDTISDAIEKISDESIKKFVIRVVSFFPESFFVMPSSPPDSHLDYPPDEAGEGGNVLHTIRVVRAVEVLSIICDLEQEDHDLLIAAAILHDGWKYNELGEYTQYHAYILDEIIEDIIDVDSAFAQEEIPTTMEIRQEEIEKILRLIRVHHGSMSTIPETRPGSPAEMLFASANSIASNLAYILDGNETKEWRWSLDF